MKYRIMVREVCSNHEVELCRVAANPEQIVKAARGKMIRVQAYLSGGHKWTKMPKYESVRFEEL